MRRLLLAAPAIAALLVLSPALAGSFCWDDRQLVLDNPETLTLSAIRRVATADFWDLPQSHEPAGYWRPLVSSSFLLDKWLYGLEPLGWHLEGWLVHAAIAGGLGWWLRRRGFGPGLAAASATMWAIHPAILEPACWVSGRADLFAAALVLAALYADDRGRIWPAAGLLALALTAKEAAIGGIFAALVLQVPEDDAGWAAAARKAAPDVVRRWPYLALLAVYLTFRLVVTPAPAQPAGLAWALRVLSAPHIVGVLAAPWLGRIEYGTDLPVVLLVPGALLGTVLIAVGVARGTPLSRAGFVALLPALVGILARGAVSDRLLYLPAMFLIPAALEAIWTIRWFRAAIPAVLGAFAIISFERAGWWRDDVALFAAAAAQGAPSPRGRLNLGIATHQRGDLQAAERMLRPIAPEIREGAYEVGLVWTELGCFARAERYYRRALEIDPAMRNAAVNLVTMLSMSDRPVDAAKVAAETKRYIADPDLDRALQATGTHEEPAYCAQDSTAIAALGDPVVLGDRAHEALVRRDFRMADVLLAAALERDPSQRRARLDRAQSAALQGDLASAREQTDALRLEFPDDAATRGLDDWLRKQGH